MDYSNCTALDSRSCPERVAESASVTLWVPAGLAMGSAAALGFARFAYSLLLPEMRHGLHWSFAQAGALGTAMAVGYLFGSLLTVQAERWLGTARVFVHGLLLTAASLLAMALFRDYEVLLLLRFIAGFVTGCVFIAGFSLAARAGATSGRSSLFTIIYGSGAGIGMVLSGLLLPPVLASGWNWAGSWIVLGLLTLITIALAIPAVRSVPPIAAAAADGANVSLSQMRPILLAYFLYGAGYYALMTFVIAYLHAAGYGQTRVVDFWIVAGLAVSASMVLWGPLLGRMRGSSGVVLTTGVLIASALVLLLLQGTAAVMLSAVLFGGSLMAGAFAHLNYARGLVPSSAWTRIIATMTVMFSLGQTAGPLLCGSIADYGGMRIGMFSAIGLLVLCIALASLQRESVTQ